jgi:hypothetical protein
VRGELEALASVVDGQAAIGTVAQRVGHLIVVDVYRDAKASPAQSKSQAGDSFG